MGNLKKHTVQHRLALCSQGDIVGTYRRYLAIVGIHPSPYFQAQKKKNF